MALQGGDGGAAEDVDGEFRADAADADEQEEHRAFLGSGEAEELLGAVLRHDVVIGEQFHLVALGRKFVVTRKRDEHGVADAVAINDHMGRCRFRELAVEIRDHREAV